MVHKDTLEKPPVLTNSIVATTSVTPNSIVTNPKDPIKTNVTEPIKNNVTTTNTLTPDYADPKNGEVSYRVQIGAYQTRKPKNAFGSVSKVIEEKTEDGWYKYTTQDVKTLENANDLKNALLLMGYTHSFITPYKDGERLTIVESVEQELSVFFDLNSAIVVKDELEKINYYFRNFSANKANSITLEGHCCYLGATNYNYELSKRRVFAVEKEVKVFTNATIIPKFFGETTPKYDNSKESSRRLNRRVDVRINK
jgi:outer membrane protein OmpA-like peptidoglycan-associated protein